MSIKTKPNAAFVLLFFSLASFAFSTTTFAVQDINTVEGIFDGHEDYGYNFIATHSDDDSEYTITFQNISDVLLKQFDLNSEALIGKRFRITYQTKTVKTIDEDGFENEEEILTITNLEGL